MSILNVNKINPVGGGSTITIAGIASVTGSISVASSVTATTFYGSGSNLTGIDATTLKDSSGNIKIQGNNSGAVVSGILTVNQDDDRTTFMTGNSVGVGTTNTTGRNAGVRLYDSNEITNQATAYGSGSCSITVTKNNDSYVVNVTQSNPQSAQMAAFYYFESGGYNSVSTLTIS